MFIPIFFPMGGSRYSGPPPTFAQVVVTIPIVLLILIQGGCFILATFAWMSDPRCYQMYDDQDDMECIIIEKFGPKPSLLECYAGMFIMEWRMIRRIA